MCGKRILAFLIDFMMICLLPVVANLISFTNISEKSIAIIYLFSLIICIVLLVTRDVCGASLGKRIMNLKVSATNGHKLTLGRIILRNITVFIWPVEAILILLEHKKIGDRIAKTNVVKNLS